MWSLIENLPGSIALGISVHGKKEEVANKRTMSASRCSGHTSGAAASTSIGPRAQRSAYGVDHGEVEHVMYYGKAHLALCLLVDDIVALTNPFPFGVSGDHFRNKP